MCTVFNEVDEHAIIYLQLRDRQRQKKDNISFIKICTSNCTALMIPLLVSILCQLYIMFRFVAFDLKRALMNDLVLLAENEIFYVRFQKTRIYTEITIIQYRVIDHKSIWTIMLRTTIMKSSLSRRKFLIDFGHESSKKKKHNIK